MLESGQACCRWSKQFSVSRRHGQLSDLPGPSGSGNLEQVNAHGPLQVGVLLVAWLAITNKTITRGHDYGFALCRASRSLQCLHQVGFAAGGGAVVGEVKQQYDASARSDSLQGGAAAVDGVKRHYDASDRSGFAAGGGAAVGEVK